MKSNTYHTFLNSPITTLIKFDEFWFADNSMQKYGAGLNTEIERYYYEK